MANSKIVQLTVAMYNAAPGAANLAAMEGFYTANSSSLSKLADALAASSLFSDQFAGMNNSQIADATIAHFGLSRAVMLPTEATSAYNFFKTELDKGATIQSLMVAAVDFLAIPANAAVYPTASATLANKATVAEYYSVTKALSAATIADLKSVVAAVTSDAASVTTAEKAVDALGTVTGQSFMLTELRDLITGTAGDDTIYGSVGQNQNGALSNAFSTGDVINAGAGTDTIVATLMNDNEVDGANANFDINVVTTGVEIAKFTVLDEGVRVDAGAMDSVAQFWSVNSDDSGLVLEDVRTGATQITKDITFGMKDVDFESDLTAMFDSNSFKKAAATTTNSQILIEAGYEDAPADVSNTNPTKDLFIKVKFTHDGKTFDSGYLNTSTNTTDTYPDTYEGLKGLLQAALTAQGFGNLTVEFGSDITSIRTDAGVKALQVTAKQILIKDPAGKAFTGVTSAAGAESTDPTSDVASRILAVDPTVVSQLIESNLILDNAGRGSTAGDVMIGAMSNSNAGIEKFNVMVDRSSAIESLKTTNGKLQQIEITSLTNKGDLEIGELDANIVLVDASKFAGANLMLGTTVEATKGNTDAEDHTVGLNLNGDDTATVKDVLNLKTLSAAITGNVTFYGATSEAAENSSGNTFAYTTGSGNDKIDVNLDGNSVDSKGESFSINANDGTNTVIVELEDETTVSYTTMNGLANMSITTGSGVDTITNSGVARFDIKSGAGSDFVVIESRNDAAAGGADVAGNATTGTWKVSVTDEDASISLKTWNDRVLYQAKLTVNFAGFESQVTIPTTASNGFVATQMDINTAIKAAIAANPELKLMLSTKDTTDAKGLTITSNVEGLNDFTIDIFQPELIASGTPTATQVLAAAGDEAGLRTGLITTLDMGAPDSNLIADDSAQVATMATIISVFNGATAIVSGTVGDGYLVASGAVAAPNDQTSAYSFFATGSASGTDGTNETNVQNFSKITMGAGSNDLVVLNSDNAALDGDIDANATVEVGDAILSTNVAQFSVNTLVFGAEFNSASNKTTVVNFFTNQNNGTDGMADHAENELSDATTGSHVLDFTYWLDDKIDTSTTPTGNGESTQRVATTARVDAAATMDITKANEVIVVNDFVKGAATTTNSGETFANLTAEKLKMALEGTTQGTDTAYGNLAVAADAAVAQAADDNIDGIVDVATGTDTAKIDSIFMIENDDNQGEYKVFNVEWSNIDNTSGTGSIEDATVTLLGIIDFGESIGTTTSYTDFSSNFA